MGSLVRVILANGDINDRCGGSLILSYRWADMKCFQYISAKAVITFRRNLFNDVPELLLAEGFSVDIDMSSSATAFSEIKFRNESNPSLNFELPMGLVKRIIRCNGDNSGLTLDINFKLFT